RGRRRPGRAHRRAGRRARAGRAHSARRGSAGGIRVGRAREAGRRPGGGIRPGRARSAGRRAGIGGGRARGTRRARRRARVRREGPREALETRLVAARARRSRVARLGRGGRGVEEAYQLRRAETGLHGRARRTRSATAGPETGRDRLARVAVGVVPLLVVVLVRGVEIVEAGRLLLVAVVADVRVVVPGRGATVARVGRRVLHETVVLAGETRARPEDRGVAAREVDVPRRRARVRLDLDVVGAADPVRRVVAALDEAGDLAEDVAAAADVVGQLRPAVCPADRDGERQALPYEVVGAVQVVV